MATRSVRAFIHNETGTPLIRVSDSCPHGEWTTRPPDRIEPHSTATVRARSIALGGVESRATWSFAGDTGKTVYVHWVNPISGSNSYNTNTAPGTYSFWSGETSGSDPVAHFFVRPAGKRGTDFLPSRDGFKFKNYWDNAPYALPPLRGTLLDQKYGNAKDGLCGGMVLTAMDYFVAGQEIPAMTNAPSGEKDPLFLHLVDRLFDTFSVNSVSLMLKLMNPLYPDTDENILNTFGLANGRAAVMANQEWPLIRADIDAGRPSPVCLIAVKSLNPGDLGENHQVLAYAYEADGHDITLHIYDPNQPLVDSVRMRFTDGDVSQRIVVRHNVAFNVTRPIYCFIRMANGPKAIPFETRPRLGAAERSARRIHITPRKPVRLEHRQVASGKKTFPVFPNCGEREFPYVVNADKWQLAFEASTPFYRDPMLTWKINGCTVAAGSNRELLVPAEAERPAQAPRRTDRTYPGGQVMLRTTLVGRELQVVNDPEDGNYILTVQAEAKEPADPSSETRATLPVEVEGLAVDIKGLQEANVECWKKYLGRYLNKPVAVGAVAEALYAQLGRPADPLWDPDPDARRIGALVAEADPAVKQITTWTRELKAVQKVTPRQRGAKIGAGARLKVRDKGELERGARLGAKVKAKVDDDVKLGNRRKLGGQVKLGDRAKLGNPVKLGDQVKLGNKVKLGDKNGSRGNAKLGDAVKRANQLKPGIKPKAELKAKSEGRVRVDQRSIKQRIR